MEWFMTLDPRIHAALIAAVAGLLTGFVGPVVKHYFDKWSLEHKLETEHEYEERKKLRRLVGSYHGRAIELAERLNHRLWNLQKNESKEWLDVNGDYSNPRGDYYFSSTVYRFSSFISVLREFQKDAIYIDTRIAKNDDILFLKYAKAIEWSITDTVLFKNIDYDEYYSTDHIFRGYLHIVCDTLTKDKKPVSRTEFNNILSEKKDIEKLSEWLQLFDGLKKKEERPRWDRIVIFHLLLMSFLNTFGYDVQKSDKNQFYKIASSVQNVSTLEVLTEWLERLGLSCESGTHFLGESINKVIEERNT